MTTTTLRPFDLVLQIDHFYVSFSAHRKLLSAVILIYYYYYYYIHIQIRHVSLQVHHTASLSSSVNGENNWLFIWCIVHPVFVQSQSFEPKFGNGISTIVLKVVYYKMHDIL